MRNGYLNEAKNILELAKEEYLQAKKVKSEMKTRQAAEKGYLSLTKIIRAIFVANGAKGALPRGERGRFHFLVQYADKETRDKYLKIKDALHIEAFHEGNIDYTILDEQFADLERMVKKAEHTSHN